MLATPGSAQKLDLANAHTFAALPNKGSSFQLNLSTPMARNAPMLAALVCCICLATVSAGTYEILQDTSKFSAVTWVAHMGPVRSTLYKPCFHNAHALFIAIVMYFSYRSRNPVVLRIRQQP